MVSPAYGTDGEKGPYDIILFDGSSTYYIAKVEEIDSSTESFMDKVLIAELLLANNKELIAEYDVLSHYLEDVDITVYDEQVKEDFNY